MFKMMKAEEVSYNQDLISPYSDNCRRQSQRKYLLARIYFLDVTLFIMISGEVHISCEAVLANASLT